MKDKIRVLFLCGRNTARSQMGEAFLRHIGGDVFDVWSAGLEPGDGVLPIVREVMGEVGIDMSDHYSKSAMELLEKGLEFDIVVTVCDAAMAGRCPDYPGVSKRLHWPFPDPAALEGSHEERLQGARKVRDMIRDAVIELMKEETEGRAKK
ncbi:MAG: arsenate reductase ArsC [Thermanaerothrix sp.]|nr:arsenate reductase ArsC [Thermanaerothrix sp.]